MSIEPGYEATCYDCRVSAGRVMAGITYESVCNGHARARLEEVEAKYKLALEDVGQANQEIELLRGEGLPKVVADLNRELCLLKEELLRVRTELAEERAWIESILPVRGGLEVLGEIEKSAGCKGLDVVDLIERLRGEVERVGLIVRHYRMEALEDGLIDDTEYESLAADDTAVGRLEGYETKIERLRRQVTELETLKAGHPAMCCGRCADLIAKAEIRADRWRDALAGMPCGNPTAVVTCGKSHGLLVDPSHYVTCPRTLTDCGACDSCLARKEKG